MTKKENVYCIQFSSRNKDNKDVEGFKPRQEFFLYAWNSDAYDELHEKFMNFVNRGVHGEASRLYISVNTRDLDAAKKELLCRMIKDDSFDLMSINKEIVSCAMTPGFALTKHWLFDFDNISDIEDFILDVGKYGGEVISYTRTPHGYAVITERGFDTRKLAEKWAHCCELKRDAFQFSEMATKE